MPSKREVLGQLKRDELQAAVDRFELDVHDRRVRDQLVDALAGSRRASLAEVLGELPRTRLKEVCRALDLDDSGRVGSLRDTLLPKLISGELRVEDAERFLDDRGL